MPPVKGRTQRRRSEPKPPAKPVVFAKVDPDVRKLLDDVCDALNLPLAAVVEEFVNATPLAEDGLPEWAHERLERIREGQLPLPETA